MALNSSQNEATSAAESALSVLQAFATASQVTFDRILADRVLGEAEYAIAGDDALAWSLRLVQVGESLNLRIRYLECTLEEVLAQKSG